MVTIESQFRLPKLQKFPQEYPTSAKRTRRYSAKEEEYPEFRSLVHSCETVQICPTTYFEFDSYNELYHVI